MATNARLSKKELLTCEAACPCCCYVLSRRFCLDSLPLPCHLCCTLLMYPLSDVTQAARQMTLSCAPQAVKLNAYTTWLVALR